MPLRTLLKFVVVPAPKTAELYPELAPFATAMKRRDWPTLRLLFGQLPPIIDPTWAVQAAIETKGCETFLERLVKEDRTSTLPRLLLAERYVRLGWEARSAKRARYVSREQFQVFFGHLGQAEKLLESVTDEEPFNIAAWTGRIRTARGLEMGKDEARRRYIWAAQSFSNPVYAQRQLLQVLCPKWSGSFPELHAFAQECAAVAPPGSVNAAVVAEGYVEEFFDLPTKDDRIAFFQQPDVVKALIAAADRSVNHPPFVPGPGWVWANSTFAFAFRYAGEYARALPLFRANGYEITYPWTNLADPTTAWRHARAYCEKKASRAR